MIYPFTRHWGIPGTAAAVVLAAVVPTWLFLRGVMRITGCSLSGVVRLLAFPTGATLLASIAVFAIRSAGDVSGMTLPGFLLLAGGYGVTYLAATHFAGRFSGYSVVPLIKEIIASIRRK
jgi:hypothetical protein